MEIIFNTNNIVYETVLKCPYSGKALEDYRNTLIEQLKGAETL